MKKIVASEEQLQSDLVLSNESLIDMPVVIAAAAMFIFPVLCVVFGW